MARTQTQANYRPIVQVRRKALLLDLDAGIYLSPVESLSALAAFVSTATIYGAAIDTLFDLDVFNLYLLISFIYIFF